MKARIPKSFINLPQREKDIINEVMSEEVQKQVDHNMAELQKIWLQYACIVLNRNFGFGRKRCLLFLANWREVYRHNNNIQSKEEQTEYLAREMDRIFGKGGYPQKYIEKLEDI